MQFKFRNITLLFGGHIISQLGTVIFNISLVWWIAETTGSTNTLGVLLALSLIPAIFLNLIGGVVVDTFNRKHILIIVDVISGLGCLFLGWYSIQQDYNFFVLLAVNMLINIGFSFFSPAARSIVPELIEGEFLKKCNSIFSTSLEITKILGPALAGVLIPVIGAPGVFLLNGVTFLLSAFSEMFIRYKKEVTDTSNKLNVLNDLKSTFNYIKQNVWLKKTLLIVTVFNFFSAGILLLMPYFVLNELNNDSGSYGMLLSVQATGAIIASIMLTLSKKKEASFKSLYLNLLACGAVLSLNIYPNLFLLGVTMFFYGFFLTRFNVNFFTFVQQNVDQVYMGKVFSFIFTSALLFMPLGNIIFGFVGGFILPYVFLLIGGGIIITTLLIVKGMKNYAKPHENLSR